MTALLAVAYAEIGDWTAAEAAFAMPLPWEHYRYPDLMAALCNPEEWWSPRSRSDAILDIERHQHRYYVLWPGHGETDICIVNGPTGRRLHTDSDTTPHNNLNDLPPC